MNGSPSPAVYATSSNAPWPTVWEVEASAEDGAEDDPDARRPADGEDRPETERGEPAAAGTDEPAAQSVTDAGPARRPRPGRRERHRPGRTRERASGAGIERAPGPFEARQPKHAGQVQAEDDQDHAADLAKDGEVLREPGRGERRGNAEEREDRAEAGDVGEGVPERQPAARAADCSPASAGIGRDRDGRQLAEIGGDERQHAR